MIRSLMMMPLLLLLACQTEPPAAPVPPPAPTQDGRTITFTVPAEIAAKAQAEGPPPSRYVAPPAPHNPALTASYGQITADPPEEAALAAGRAAAEAWLAAHPDDAEALYLIGHSYVREKKFPEAQDPLARTVALAPDNLPARKDYAGTLLSIDRCPESLPHLDVLMAAGFTEQGEIPYMRSFCRKQAGDLHGALADIELACAAEYPKSCRLSKWLQGRIAASAEAPPSTETPTAPEAPAAP